MENHLCSPKIYEHQLWKGDFPSSLTTGSSIAKKDIPREAKTTIAESLPPPLEHLCSLRVFGPSGNFRMQWTPMIGQWLAGTHPCHIHVSWDFCRSILWICELKWSESVPFNGKVCSHKHHFWRQSHEWMATHWKAMGNFTLKCVMLNRFMRDVYVKTNQ
jgi:hypothetical protein